MSSEATCPNCGRPDVPFAARRDECCTAEDGELVCLRLTVERMRPVVEAARSWRTSLGYGQHEALSALRRALDALDGKAGTP